MACSKLEARGHLLHKTGTPPKQISRECILKYLRSSWDPTNKSEFPHFTNSKFIDISGRFAFGNLDINVLLIILTNHQILNTIHIMSADIFFVISIQKEKRTAWSFLIWNGNVNPISTRGADYAHHSNPSPPPGFSNLVTPLFGI